MLMLFTSKIKKKWSKSDICASSNVSTVQVLLIFNGSTDRQMPSAIDGLPALMATIRILGTKVKTPYEKWDLADTG